MAKHLLSYHRYALLAFCILVGFTEMLVAAPRETDDNKVAEGETQEASAARSLNHPISIEDSMRLRRDLDEYTRTVDPAHVQIEERRRLMHQRIQARFGETDKDNDGKISREEATESLPQVARHFNEVDTNNDGYLSLDELEGLQAKIAERQRAMAIRVEAPEPEPVKRKSKDAALTVRKRTL